MLHCGLSLIVCLRLIVRVNLSLKLSIWYA